MGRKMIKELEGLRTSVRDADRVRFGRLMVKKFDRVPATYRKKLSFDNLAWVYHEACRCGYAAADRRQWKTAERYAIIVNVLLESMRMKARRSKRISLAF